MRSRNGIVLAAAVAVVAALAPARSDACKCAHPKADPATAFSGADLVVEAEVDAHEFVIDIGFRTRLTVANTYKGHTTRKLVIVASKTCAVGFEVGTRYLVYAHSDGDAGFSTNFCSRTAPLADASDDLAAIARRRPSSASSKGSLEGLWARVFDEIDAFLGELVGSRA